MGRGQKDAPKRKPGRPVGTHAPATYTRRFQIKLSQEQYSELVRRAADAGLPPSVYARRELGLE